MAEAVPGLMKRPTLGMGTRDISPSPVSVPDSLSKSESKSKKRKGGKDRPGGVLADFNREAEMQRLMVDDILELQPIRLPAEAWRDHKKLTKFLQEVEMTVNKLIEGVQEQTRTTAEEFMSRPTFAEEFVSLRQTMNNQVCISRLETEFDRDEEVSSQDSLSSSRRSKVRSNSTSHKDRRKNYQEKGSPRKTMPQEPVAASFEPIARKQATTPGPDTIGQHSFAKQSTVRFDIDCEPAVSKKASQNLASPNTSLDGLTPALKKTPGVSQFGKARQSSKFQDKRQSTQDPPNKFEIDDFGGEHLASQEGPLNVDLEGGTEMSSSLNQQNTASLSTGGDKGLAHGASSASSRHGQGKDPVSKWTNVQLPELPGTMAKNQSMDVGTMLTENKFKKSTKFISSEKPKYFVSASFVDRIFDDIGKRQDRNRDLIMKQIKKMEDKVIDVMKIKNIDLPDIEKKFALQTQRTVQVTKQFINRTTEQRLGVLRRAAFTALQEHLKKSKHRKYLINKSIQHFRCFQLFHSFRRMKLNTNLVAQVREKDRIDGAYLLLKRFKDRLKGFDRALQLIQGKKANVDDFVTLKHSLDPSRAQNIFNDMKVLVDSSIQSLDRKLDADKAKHQKMFERIIGDQQAHARQLQANYDRVIAERVDKFEEAVQRIADEQGKLASRLPNEIDYTKLVVAKRQSSPLQQSQQDQREQQMSQSQEDRSHLATQLENIRQLVSELRDDQLDTKQQMSQLLTEQTQRLPQAGSPMNAGSPSAKPQNISINIQPSITLSQAGQQPPPDDRSPLVKLTQPTARARTIALSPTTNLNMASHQLWPTVMNQDLRVTEASAQGQYATLQHNDGLSVRGPDTLDYSQHSAAGKMNATYSFNHSRRVNSAARVAQRAPGSRERRNLDTHKTLYGQNTSKLFQLRNAGQDRAISSGKVGQLHQGRNTGGLRKFKTSQGQWLSSVRSPESNYGAQIQPNDVLRVEPINRHHQLGETAPAQAAIRPGNGYNARAHSIGLYPGADVPDSIIGLTNDNRSRLLVSHVRQSSVMDDLGIAHIHGSVYPQSENKGLESADGSQVSKLPLFNVDGPKEQMVPGLQERIRSQNEIISGVAVDCKGAIVSRKKLSGNGTRPTEKFALGENIDVNVLNSEVSVVGSPDVTNVIGSQSAVNYLRRSNGQTVGRCTPHREDTLKLHELDILRRPEAGINVAACQTQDFRSRLDQQDAPSEDQLLVSPDKVQPSTSNNDQY